MCGVHLWGGAVSLKYGIHMTETWATMLAGNILRLLQDFRSQESKVQLPSVSLFSLVPTPQPPELRKTTSSPVEGCYLSLPPSV